MAESSFDRARFAARLETRRLGRTLELHGETGSTNDDLWELAAQGAQDGTVVIADHQTRGRGREGRAWHDAPGLGLALSVLLHAGGSREALATTPLVAGVALARGLMTLGVEDAELKWPNDVLLDGRKLAGLLCESRRLSGGVDAVVIGLGLNVAQQAADFPPELRDTATSLAGAGHVAPREDAAAAFVNALEPLWDEHQRSGPRAVLEAWRGLTRCWGRPVSVRSAHGTVAGEAVALADDGALIVRTADGAEVRVVAGDVRLDAATERR